MCVFSNKNSDSQHCSIGSTVMGVVEYGTGVWCSAQESCTIDMDWTRNNTFKSLSCLGAMSTDGLASLLRTRFLVLTNKLMLIKINHIHKKSKKTIPSQG